MTRGRTKSRMTRSQRIEEAHRLFARGFSNADVARELSVHADTVTSYRKLYEEGMAKQAASNPYIFEEVFLNTQRALTELDEVRTDAWAQIRKTREIHAECVHCGEDTVYLFPLTDAARAKYHGIILNAQTQRAQLHQLLTNRTEILVRHEHTRIVQERILAWLRDNLPLDYREKLALFIEAELSEFMGELPAAKPTNDEEDIIEAEIVSAK